MSPTCYENKAHAIVGRLFIRYVSNVLTIVDFYDRTRRTIARFYTRASVYTRYEILKAYFDITPRTFLPSRVIKIILSRY